jgi:hypothetical protein
MVMTRRRSRLRSSPASAAEPGWHGSEKGRELAVERPFVPETGLDTRGLNLLTFINQMRGIAQARISQHFTQRRTATSGAIQPLDNRVSFCQGAAELKRCPAKLERGFIHRWPDIGALLQQRPHDLFNL